MNFLIIDDDLQIARLLQLTLEREGIASEIAASAEVAQNMLVTGKYDALVVDAILPGESGISLVSKIRKEDPEMPVLFCTGANDEFNKQLMWKMGLVCHKPLDASLPNVLRQFVNSCVKPR